jgi:hypothetical protein
MSESKAHRRAVKIREDFMDRPHRRAQKVTWDWPTEFTEIGDCYAVMYTSDKWNPGKKKDYKHVAEGPQKVLVPVPTISMRGEGARRLAGPTVTIDDFPDTFAVLADSLGLCLHLYENDKCKLLPEDEGFCQIDYPRSKLGAGTFPDGANFVFIYDSRGVHAVVIGEKLDVLKDGIVG